ncbi:MAG: HAMP domain-containing histidine kinase [Bacteroidales bacterium]|nr:HAMP domain-containing histidine kinase [Bacteroidales bacterium]
MKKKGVFYFIVVLMSVSLLLIILMQGGHIIRSYNEKKELVDRGVLEALTQAWKRLERQDALYFAYNKLHGSKTQDIDSAYPVDPYMMHFDFDGFGSNSKNFSISISSAQGGTQVFNFSNILSPDGFLTYPAIKQFFDENLTNQQLEFNELIAELEKEYELQRRPIEARFDKNFIKTVISNELAEKDLDIDFEFAVIDANQNIRISSDDFSENFSSGYYKINLSSANIFTNPDFLYVYFPHKGKFVVEGIYAQILSSVIFTLIIIFTFGITLRTVIRQKKLTEIKNDFINNMTHELKTPIATIQLAAESIKNPKLRENQVILEKFTDIISQETHRMNQHVEQVLQMALLDRESLNLKREEIDMHELIVESVDKIDLIIKERNGRIRNFLKADEYKIIADRDTMQNVVNNLLDNANKYSTEAPEITIYTYNMNNLFVLEVEDKGIGMSKETQNKIFDRFFRAEGGNIHNIKGFGLGLNYVREIVLAHKGEIEIKSQANKGSSFIIKLPLQST